MVSDDLFFEVSISDVARVEAMSFQAKSFASSENFSPARVVEKGPLRYPRI